MEFLLEFKSFKYKEGDIVLVHYWYTYDVTPVKILEKVGNKFKITHNVEDSKIFNAPDELIKSSDIIDYFRK